MDYVETQWQMFTMISKKTSNVDCYATGHIAQVGGGSERLRKEIEGEIAERLREMRTIARKK